MGERTPRGADLDMRVLRVASTFSSPRREPVWTTYLPSDWRQNTKPGALIIDIRPAEQRARDGELPGAVVVERNALEWRLDPLCDHRIPEVSGHDDRIVLVCNEGYGSSLAAATLHDIGLHHATDLIGGFQAWLALDHAPPLERHAQPCR